MASQLNQSRRLSGGMSWGKVAPMWSGKFWSVVRTPLMALAASALGAISLGGCAIGTSAPSWFSTTMLEQLRTQQEYSDYITARYAGMIGDSEAAAKFYHRAYEAAPNDAGLLERALLSALVSGDAANAVRIAKGAKAVAAEDAPTAQLALILDDINSNRLKSAQTRARKPILGALNIDLAVFLDTWLMAADDPNGAVTMVDQLPGRRMIAGEQAVLKALVLMKAGQDVEAVEAFRHALRLPLTSRDAVAALGANLAASGGDVAAARELIGLVSEEMAGAGIARVVADLDAGVKIARPKLDVRQGAAMVVHVVSGTGLVRSSPELSVLRQSMALYLDPTLAPARIALADAQERRGHPDDAIVALRAVPDGSPWAADARMDEAYLLDSIDQHGEALAAAETALGLSDRREIVLRAGDLNRLNDRMDVALKLYDRVIAGDEAQGKADWRVLFARANVRSEIGDWPAAEADLQAAMALEPDRPELLNYLGYGWVKRGERVQEGLALIQRAAEARPDQGYIVDSLGWAHYQLGQYDEAIGFLERAAELSPTDPEIIDHLGDAYWRAGRAVEAGFEWTAALDLKPDPQRAAALREKLAKGLPAGAGASLASRP